MNKETISWEEKVELIQLLNQATEGTKIERDILHSYILEKIELFDNQAYDMLANGLQIVESQINEDISFHVKLSEYIYNIDLDELSLRAAIRFEFIKSIYKDLKIKT